MTREAIKEWFMGLFGWKSTIFLDVDRWQALVEQGGDIGESFHQCIKKDAKGRPEVTWKRK